MFNKEFTTLIDGLGFISYVRNKKEKKLHLCYIKIFYPSQADRCDESRTPRSVKNNLIYNLVQYTYVQSKAIMPSRCMSIYTLTVFNHIEF